MMVWSSGGKMIVNSGKWCLWKRKEVVDWDGMDMW